MVLCGILLLLYACSQNPSLLNNKSLYSFRILSVMQQCLLYVRGCLKEKKKQFNTEKIKSSFCLTK